MASVRAAVLLWLLVQAAGVPAEQLSPADQLARLLGPIVESAVTRALADWRPTALSELGRLQGRLEVLEREVADIRSRVPLLPPADRCQTGTVPEGTSGPSLLSDTVTEPPREPACEETPAPLPEGVAQHRRPATLACARSCLQLQNQGGSPPPDGVYWFTGMPVPVLCDFSHDGGGWTLLLTAATRDGWDPLSVLKRSEYSPSITSNYAILRYADAIRDLGSGDRFAYRIEAQAETGRRRRGGVWFVPRAFSFVSESPSQTDVSVMRKFDNWNYKNLGIEKRMPWLNTGDGPAVLTTSSSPSSHWWGTLVTQKTTVSYHHSPWTHGAAVQSGRVLYWVREETV